MKLETLSEDLVDSKVKYIRELFQDETLMVDVADDDYISIVHHTYNTVSFATCRKVANHIRKALKYDKTIFVGAYIFEAKRETF